MPYNNLENKVEKDGFFMIYGVALLSACAFIGSLIGNLLGLITGLNSNIGGVGFAIVLLLIATNSKTVNKILPQNYTKGILFWKEMFIPVIIAMSASTDVVHALDGGVLALALGVGVVVVMLLLIPVFNKFGGNSEADAETEAEA